jgi:hypothetical protein
MKPEVSIANFDENNWLLQRSVLTPITFCSVQSIQFSGGLADEKKPSRGCTAHVWTSRRSVDPTPADINSGPVQPSIHLPVIAHPSTLILRPLPREYQRVGSKSSHESQLAICQLAEVES